MHIPSNLTYEEETRDGKIWQKASKLQLPSRLAAPVSYLTRTPLITQESCYYRLAKLQRFL